MIMCNGSGQWNTTLPSCQAATHCPSLDPPMNGTLSTVSTSIGVSVTVTCNLGYKLSGLSTIVCQNNGQWNSTVPTCEPVKCTALSNNSHVIADPNKESYIAGDVVSFMCDNGYLLAGSSAIICDEKNGQWNASEPVCNKRSVSSGLTGSPAIIGSVLGIVIFLLVIIVVVVVFVLVMKSRKRTSHPRISVRVEDDHIQLINNDHDDDDDEGTSQPSGALRFQPLPTDDEEPLDLDEEKEDL